VAAAKAHDIMALKSRGGKALNVNFKEGVYARVAPFLADARLSRVSVCSGYS
jgi:hypothetical protein